MNHCGIAYFDRGRISLPNSLLSPLSISPDESLDVLYYPRPDSYDGNRKGIEVKHDFLVTSIPYSSWHRVLGVRLDIANEPGAMAAVAKYLAGKGINTLLVNCARSGHRFAIWTLVLDVQSEVFTEEFREKRQSLTPEQLEQIGSKPDDMRIARVMLKWGLKEHCEKSFSVPNRRSKYDRDPINIWRFKALEHFSQAHEQDPEQYPRLKAECKSRGVIEISDAAAILGHRGILEESPTLGVATLDADSFIIRVAVLTQEQLGRFRMVLQPYTFWKSGPNPDTRGLVATLTENLKKDWNLWMFKSYPRRNDSQVEKGEVELIMEYQGRGKTPGEKKIRESIKKAFHGFPSIAEESGEAPRLELESPDVTRLSAGKVFLSLRNKANFARRDDVISWTRLIGREFGFMPEDIIVIETYRDRSITQTVATEISRSIGMIQFYMGESDEGSDWLNGEFFLASAWGLPTVRIVDPKIEHKMVFDRDKTDLELSEVAGNDEYFRVLRQAFEQIEEAKNMGENWLAGFGGRPSFE